MKLHRRGSALSLVLVCVSLSGLSQAYCRQTTCDPEKKGAACDAGADGCVIEGSQLFYESPCLGFGVAEGSGASLGLTDERFGELVAEAFKRWATVDCGQGQTPGFDVQTGPAVESNGKFFCEPVPELNLSVWSFERPWPYPKEKDSLGFTTSVFDVATGQVFDADVEINLSKVASSSVPQEGRERQLLAIMTHEAGHFLGLAHSQVPGAVMAASYTQSDLLSKQLAQDDVDGICAIYPPAQSKLTCGEIGVSDAALFSDACNSAALPPAEGGCSVSGTPLRFPNHGPLWGLGLVLGVVAWRRGLSDQRRATV